jgi:polysaccharide pyruvyl transferase WcaK-like protein
MKILILNDTRAENHHGCSRVMNAIDRNLFIRNEYEVSYLKLMTRWDLDEDIKRKIIQTDLLIINGEGTLHGDLIHVRCLLNAISFAKSYGVTVAVINTTLYDLSNKSINILAKVDYLYVRDMASKKLIEENGINVFYCPDLVFWEPFPLEKEIYRSGWAVTDGYGPTVLDAEMRKNSSTPITISNLEQRFYKLSKLRKVLIRLISIINFSRSVKPLSDSTQVDFLRRLNSFEFVLTGRYHIVCMCLLLEIPFKFIDSNTPKISFLLSDIGLDLDKFFYRPDSLRFDFNDSELSKIKFFKSEAQIKIKEMFDNILISKLPT